MEWRLNEEEDEGPLAWLELLVVDTVWLCRAERGNLAAVAWPMVHCDTKNKEQIMSDSKKVKGIKAGTWNILCKVNREICPV